MTQEAKILQDPQKEPGKQPNQEKDPKAQKRPGREKAKEKAAVYQQKLDASYVKHRRSILSIKNAILILAGNALVAYSFVGFVRANGFLSGGAFGLAGMLNHLIPAIAFPVAVLIFNFPAVLLAWFSLRRPYVVMASFCILLQVVFLQLFDGIVIYNNDPLLASVFAGVLMGAGDGLVLRSGSSSSVIHLVSMVLKKRLGLSVSTIATSINLVIVALSASVFGLEKGLYTLIMIFISGRAMNLVLDGVSRKRTAFIVTTKGEEIGKKLLEFLNRGVTMMPAKGLYSMQEANVLLCVVNMLEVGRLKEIVREVDRHAFITIYETAEVSGRFMKNNAIVDKDPEY